MAITASLKLVLLADDVPVAESDDAVLWQAALRSIHTGKALLAEERSPPEVNESSKPRGSSNPIEKFAEQLAVGADQLIGACGPSNESPFIHLDPHYWSAFHANFPATGKNAVAAATLAATLLVLWQRHAGVELPTTGAVRRVLDSLGLDGSSITRSIGRCAWLQLRNDRIQLNPAEVAQADAVSRAYVLKQPLGAIADKKEQQ